nr:MAG TPA: LipB/octanoyl transferase [Caudoviricetes sp.]
MGGSHDRPDRSGFDLCRRSSSGGVFLSTPAQSWTTMLVRFPFLR